MYYLYQSHNETAGIAKIGITRQGKAGATRIRDYARQHSLPVEGWSAPRHYALHTNDLREARTVERVAHASYVAAGKTVCIGCYCIREVFKASAAGAHWTVIRAMKGLGYYSR